MDATNSEVETETAVAGPDVTQLVDIGPDQFEFTVQHVKFVVQRGDIKKAETEAIVNYTDIHLSDARGGVTKAILKAAGHAVQKECEDYITTHERIQGVAKTGGGNLPCGYILHINIDNGDQIPKGVFDVLKFANDSGMKSITFPLCTGQMNVSTKEFVERMVQAVREYSLLQPELREICVRVFQRSALANFHECVELLTTRSAVPEAGAVPGQVVPECVPGESRKHTSAKDQEITESKLKVPVYGISGKCDGENSFTKDHDIAEGKLEALVCDSSGKFDGNTFHIIVANGLEHHHTNDEMMDRFAFLKGIDYKAVFDFDPEGQLYRFMEENMNENMTIFTVDEFDPKSLQNDRTKGVFQDTDGAHQNMWIIVNGNEHMHMPKMDNREWTQKRSEGFKEITRRMKMAMPSGRVAVVFMLLSKEYDLMKKMTEEIVCRFGDTWCMIAECDSDAKSYQEYMTENICDEDELAKKSVVGMPWTTINKWMVQLVGSLSEPLYELPTSGKDHAILDEGSRKRWIHIDVVPANQHTITTGKDFEQQRQISEEYFRGAAVDWGNFVSGDVLTRTEVTRLKGYVCNVLDNPHNNGSYVKIITLFHEPGAGGTSTASQVLWDLKKEYRCAVVKRIKQGQTSEEISNFHRFKDDSPKPVLLLFDNQDEEGVSMLKAELEEKAKMFVRHAKKEQRPIFYVFLQCVRQAAVKRPQKPKPWYFAVVQQLDNEEKRLFREKSHDMERKFEEREPYSINPANMISFNVMKNNFDESYVENIVKTMLTEVKNPKEIMLLKFVSLLNSFDLSFRALPLTVFDQIMVPHLSAKEKVPLWELELSQPMNVLLYITRKRKDCKRVRISHNALSLTILRQLLEKDTPSKKRIYHVIHDFLDCPGLFDGKTEIMNQYKRYVLKVVCEIVKKRRRDFSTGQPETRFASLIESIRKEGGNEKAAGLLIKVYELSNDLFVGQQLARFYIDAKNWEMARSCAEDLVRRSNRNSYLLDTLGQTYKMEVTACYAEVVEQDSILEISKARRIMTIAFKAISIFQKAQKLNEDDTDSYQNDAGYFNELLTIVKLLDSLSLVEVLKSPGTLQSLLSGKHVRDEVLHVFEERHITEIRKLKGYVMRTTIKLKDEFQQLKVDWGNEFRERKIQAGKSNLKRCIDHLSTYFLCLFDAPRNEEERCDNRRRETKQLGVYTFKDMIKLGDPDKGESLLLKISDLMQRNMRTEFGNPSDLQTYLSANLSLCLFHPEPNNLQEMAEVSCQLYSKRDTFDITVLEPYLFVTLLNWPEQCPTQKKPLPVCEIREIITNWKDAYYRKFPRQRELGKPCRKKDTTVAFLGVGEGMSKYVFHRALVKGGRFDEYVGEFWEQPQVLERLDRWQGVLINEGCDVSFQIQEGQFKETLEIPTRLPVNKPEWYRKKVFVVVGFTWAGPRAFHVTRDDPRTTMKTTKESADTCDVKDDSRQSRDLPEERAQLILHLPAKFNTKEFAERFRHLQKQLDEIHALKTKTGRKTKEQVDKLDKEDSLRQSFRRLLWDKHAKLDDLSENIEFI